MWSSMKIIHLKKIETYTEAPETLVWWAESLYRNQSHWKTCFLGHLVYKPKILCSYSSCIKFWKFSAISVLASAAHILKLERYRED